MREFKFRKFNKTLGKMIYSDEFDSLLSFFEFIENMRELYEFSELMQFTGVLDSNQDLIYEGDLIKTSNKIGFIIYVEPFGTFVLEELCKECGKFSHMINELYQTIVIGNIYETPELMEIK